MLNSEICKEISSRLAGAAVGVREGEGGGLLSALSGLDCGIKFTDAAPDCAAYIFGGEGAFDARLAEGKPYVVVAVNAEEAAKTFACAVQAGEYGREEWLLSVIEMLAGEFPLAAVNIDIPEWMRFLPQENSALSELIARVRAVAPKAAKCCQAGEYASLTEGAEYWTAEISVNLSYASGVATVTCTPRDGIFFDMLSELAGDKIEGEFSLMRYVRSAAEAKKCYSKVRDALDCARVNGYGIVSPSAEDLSYEQPQVVRQGGSVGIKLKASAPAYHIIRVDVSGEVSPIMGEASQSENIVKNMMNQFATDAEEAWNTDVFGKSLRAMVQEGLSSKVSSLQEETRVKLRKAVTRMANEGKGGIICIIL